MNWGEVGSYPCGAGREGPSSWPSAGSVWPSEMGWRFWTCLLLKTNFPASELRFWLPTTPPCLGCCQVTFKEPFDASHLLDHLSKLGVLSEELLDVSGGHPWASGHPLDPVGLLTEQLCSVFAVQLCTEDNQSDQLDQSQTSLTRERPVRPALHDSKPSSLVTKMLKDNDSS